MKEAAGEANMTVITILLIGVIAAIAIPLVSSTMTNSAKKACCQSYGGSIEGKVCKDMHGNTINDYWDSTNNKCNDY